MLRMALRVVVLLGAIGLWFGAWAVVRSFRPPDASALIAPLLPQQEGQPVCLTGSFASQVMDVEDWSKAKMEPTKHLAPNGKPYMRPVPPVMKDKPVRAFTLQLVYDTRRSDYDWIYNFRLSAQVEGIGTAFAAGECPWYAIEKSEPGGIWSAKPNSTGLGCYIDCDGGGFGLSRVAGAPALLLSFNPIGLRMKGGCGGGGTYRLKPAGEIVVFRLQRAGPEACRSLEEWASR